MQKTIVFTALLLLFNLYTQAQSEKTIKLYLNSSFANDTYAQTSNGITVTNQNISGVLQGFSPAITTTKENGRYSELEFSSFRLGASDFTQVAADSMGTNETLAGSKFFNFHTSIRYEYGFNIKALLGGPTEGVSYSLGVAIQPFIGASARNPFTSNEFRQGNINFGARFQVVPRISFGGKKNWFVDINFPINLADASGSRHRSDNPTLPLALQRFWQAQVRLLPIDLQARAGIGIRI